MHGRHDAELLSGWWKPFGHAVHWAAFWVSENRPDAHSVHVVPNVLASVSVTEPAAQAMQSLSDVAAY